MYQVSASGDRGARGDGPELKTYENMAVDNEGRSHVILVTPMQRRLSPSPMSSITPSPWPSASAAASLGPGLLPLHAVLLSFSSLLPGWAMGTSLHPPGVDTRNKFCSS